MDPTNLDCQVIKELLGRSEHEEYYCSCVSAMICYADEVKKCLLRMARKCPLSFEYAQFSNQRNESDDSRRGYVFF